MQPMKCQQIGQIGQSLHQHLGCHVNRVPPNPRGVHQNTSFPQKHHDLTLFPELEFNPKPPRGNQFPSLRLHLTALVRLSLSQLLLSDLPKSHQTAESRRSTPLDRRPTAQPPQSSNSTFPPAAMCLPLPLHLRRSSSSTSTSSISKPSRITSTRHLLRKKPKPPQRIVSPLPPMIPSTVMLNARMACESKMSLGLDSILDPEGAKKKKVGREARFREASSILNL
jgi:hypothetical protein